MTPWLLILTGGLLGSAHCVGMCGGFALLLGAGGSRFALNLARQVLYSLGRVCTYALGGAVAGYFGWRLVHGMGTVVNVQSVLSVIAGTLLVFQGLAAAGMLRRVWRRHPRPDCPTARLFAALLTGPGWGSVFVAGLANGLLPCGLVYAYLALAGSSGGPWSGAAVMAVFGLGTIPALVLVGCGGRLVTVHCRRIVFGLAAWCIIVTGALTLARGAGFLGADVPVLGAACPFCH